MRLGDKVIFTENNQEFRNNLAHIAALLREAGETIRARTDLGIEPRNMYPAIAESTATQLELLGQFLDEPVEITASICRMVFEINVTFRYCLSSPQRLHDYASQAGTDEIYIWSSMKELALKDGSNAADLRPISERIEHIQDTLRKHGMSLKPDRPSLAHMAKEIGVKDDYEAFYGLYSKYVHASAWFVLRPRAHIDLWSFRETMQINAQLYAGDTYKRLDDIASHRSG